MRSSISSRYRTILLYIAAIASLILISSTGLYFRVFAQNSEIITLFQVPVGFPLLLGGSMTSGSDGNLWFTEQGANKIAKMTPAGVVEEFLIPTQNASPGYIVAGADGNMWFNEQAGGRIGKITSQGVITEFPLELNVEEIILGPDGNVWFFAAGSTEENYIGFVTPEGSIQKFFLGERILLDIAAGPDGNVWFIADNKIGKITPSGGISEYEIPSVGSVIEGLVIGPDNNLWFLEKSSNKIGRVTVDGIVTEFTVPSETAGLTDIVPGPDGNLWFTEFGANRIGRITPEGEVTEFAIPTEFSTPTEIQVGSDGNLWFVQPNGLGPIGRITPEGVITEYPQPTFADVLGFSLTKGPDNNLWFLDAADISSSEPQKSRVGRINISNVLNPSPTPPSGFLNVPLLKQGVAPFNDNSPLWEANEYDHGSSQSLWCGETIAGCGCALTSVAMLLRYYEVVNPTNGELTTPATVNDYFNQRTNCGSGGCVSLGFAFGDVKWTAVNNYSAEANRNYGTQKIIYDGGRGFDSSVVAQDINEGRPVILGVPNHWVIGTGVSGNTFTINDPLFNRMLLSDPTYNNTASQGIRRFKKTNSDFSAIEIAALAPAQVIVTDPEGRKTGFDANSSEVVIDIPNSEYLFNESFDNGINENSPPENSGVYWAIIKTPVAGDYEIEVINQSGESSSIAVYGSDKDSNTNFKLFEDDRSTNPVYSFSYDPLPGETPLALDVPIDVRPQGNADIINPKSNGIVQVAVLSDNSFDSQSVNPESVKFGPSEAAANKKYQTKDINKDGKVDFIFSFKINETGIKNGDKEACLIGQTTDEFDVKGCGRIRTIPPIVSRIISVIKKLFN